MIFQVSLNFLDQFVFVWTVRVKPEDCRHARVTCTSYCKFHPVTDWSIFHLTHTPDVAFFHILRHQHFACFKVGDVRNTCFRNFECLVVWTVFFSFLRHQTNVWHGTHSAWVEVTVPLTEIDHFLVDTCECRFRHDGFSIILFTISTPHFTTSTDHCRHRRIYDDVVRWMEVGDAFSRVNHCKCRAVFLASMQVSNDFFTNRSWKCFNFFVKTRHTVVDVNT